MSATQAGSAARQATSELRLAVTFTGGVSLAVWMGGMAREMNLLLAASLNRRHEPIAGTTDSGVKVRDKYEKLLDLLDLDCSLDVLSGTSAGGINAAILGLANVQRLDLDGLRRLWFEQGSLGNLLRDPTDKQPPSSLLYGDKSLLSGLTNAMKGLPGRWENPDLGSDPTRVFITTTLLAGEASTFTDAYGTLVRDIDHRGLFEFTGAQLTRDHVPALALAARCSASFPVAFEPALIPIDADGGDGHPDMRDFTSAQVTQFAADGGLLADRPLGPALQAVFDRSADRDVRRVLAFVVPMLGDSQLSAAKPTVADTPGLAAALRADVTAMLSQSISGDLATITAHNQRVEARNDARQQLAVLGAQMRRPGAQMERLGTPFWRNYVAKRADSVARAASEEIMKRATVAPRAADDRPAGFGADASQTLEAARTQAELTLPPDLPEPGNDDESRKKMNLEMNKAGRDALDDGKVTVLAILTRAYRLVPPAHRSRLGELRERASDAMPHRSEPTHADTVNNVLRGVPQTLVASSVQARKEWAEKAATALLSANIQAGSRPWHDLAAVVVDLRGLVPTRETLAASRAKTAGNGAAPTAPDVAASDADFVWDLLDYLTGLNGGSEVDTVAARLFDLHVARYVMQPEGLLADQALELVQMSSDTRTCLDQRTLAADKLTGLQLSHFGAFYKGSWRANDWMWGRLDGAGWLVHVLLDPRRLHQLATEDPGFLQDLRARLQDIAGTGAPPGVWEPFPTQGGHPGEAAEMSFLMSDPPLAPPTSLPVTAMWVAAGLQRLIAGEELPEVAEQIDKDREAHAQEASAQAFVTDYQKATGAAAGAYPLVPEAKVGALLQACKVSAEKFTTEVGTGLFAKIVTRAAAVSVRAVRTTKKLPAFLRPVVAGARTVTSLAYRVAYASPVAQWPAIGGLALIGLGALASTSTITVLSAGGLAAVLAGLLLVAVSTRAIVPVLAILAFAAGAALAAAAYIPFARDHLFPWLEKSAVPSLAKRPAEWAILVLFVLLPPLWTIAAISRKMITAIMRKARSRTAKVQPQEPAADAAPAAPPESEPSFAPVT